MCQISSLRGYPNNTSALAYSRGNNAYTDIFGLFTAQRPRLYRYFKFRYFSRAIKDIKSQFSSHKSITELQESRRFVAVHLVFHGTSVCCCTGKRQNSAWLKESRSESMFELRHQAYDLNKSNHSYWLLEGTRLQIERHDPLFAELPDSTHPSTAVLFQSSLNTSFTFLTVNSDLRKTCSVFTCGILSFSILRSPFQQKK